ncbi:MAG: SufS family cysteine desulfurase [Propionibacteriaceae bacterium]|nr:SufS family cysteine desulfurase [Propionibacteriaceae bacterium]
MAAYGLPTEAEIARLAGGWWGGVPPADGGTAWTGEPYGGPWPEPGADPDAAGRIGATPSAGSAPQPGPVAPSVVPTPGPGLAPWAFPEGVSDRAETRVRHGGQPLVGNRSLADVRADFPILSERVDGKPLVWFDNAATTQKPWDVVNRLSHFYQHENSNVHRAAHALAARADDAYEGARQVVADFLGAPAADDIVFVRGTTEGINLVAQAIVRPLLRPGDEIVLTLLEHHANIVPWQLVAQATGAVLRVAGVDEDGQVDLASFAAQFTPRTKFASFAHVSNALGTVTPVGELIAIAHGHGVPTLVDGAQSVSHLPVDVAALDADFFVFSGHKIYGPTGIGAVYGKRRLWERAEPYQGGGNMIADVTFERTAYQAAPAKFEAGTGNIADAAGLAAALRYVSDLGLAQVCAYEHWLHEYAIDKLSAIPGLRLLGNAPTRTSVLSFTLEGYEPAAVGKLLSAEGIAVRAGHHCAQPILRHFGLEATVRASLAVYNTADEVDFLVETLRGLEARR